MGKSIRRISKEIGISHSTLSRILNGKYDSDPSNIIKKLLDNINGVIIREEQYDEILEMLDSARFPSKFGKAQRTATYLYDLVLNAKIKKEGKN